ncbi:diacylglycerol/lipid kinase family protein [Natribacillus halophilus]|uniref:Lipid kinase, YegS/Rv2252/BmrU family n=1 Tax=Natribacillus halophilus TaxID=549003 RepID=A0A1G8J7V0_9BACI|nr:diacylglycerol kinase family protein [Natribacillus halophilus]SDI27314.1 lipid kinase, YegS/Rv2252/BmrU family [Natribacillus halophilus]
MYSIIVNKCSGNGKGALIWKQVKKALQTKEIDYQVYFTKRSNHATAIVREINGGVIIVIGGDGTIHEVINGLIGAKTPVGIIPAGSGNDFAKALDIPTNAREALDRILHGKQQAVDIGRINGKCCVTVIGVGFDGKVAQTVNASKSKRWLNVIRFGKLSYVISVFKVLLSYKPVDITITVDGHKEDITNVWLIAVANFPYYAGGMAICPNAKGNDGFLELCVVHGMSRLQFVRAFPGVFKGKHVSHPAVKMLTGKQIEISSSTAMIVHGDGEIIGQTPIKIDVEKEALNVI